jgi:hypothetical protein
MCRFNTFTTITSKYVDEITCDVVPLETCVMVLGSLYLYDRKAIFYREQNKYHLTKEDNEYVVHAHRIKANNLLSQ